MESSALFQCSKDHRYHASDFREFFTFSEDNFCNLLQILLIYVAAMRSRWLLFGVCFGKYSMMLMTMMLQGGCGNYGTWLSAVDSFSKKGELKVIRRELYKTAVPRAQHRLPKR